MSIYEALLAVRVLPKEELRSVLKRSAVYIFNRGGFIRGIYNMGVKKPPFYFSKDNKTYREAHFFMVEFSLPKEDMPELVKEYYRDVDLIRTRLFKKEETLFDHSTCTLEDEMKPPAYRSEVQDLIAKSEALKKWKKRRNFKFNTNTNYYPFQR